MSKTNLDTILYQIEFLSEVIENNNCDEERKASVKNSLQKLKKTYSELKPEKKNQSTLTNYCTPKK